MKEHCGSPEFPVSKCARSLWIILSDHHMGLLHCVGSDPGRDLGKMALGLRVIKTDGTPIAWLDSLIRNLLRIIDGLFAYLVGAILIWNSPRKQRLGDRAANTVVVRRRA